MYLKIKNSIYTAVTHMHFIIFFKNINYFGSFKYICKKKKKTKQIYSHHRQT